MERGVIIKTVINAMVFDGATKDPMQMAVRDALISFLAATAQAQTEATREAQKAGIAYAKGQTGKYRGRKPSYSAGHIEQVTTLLETTNPNAVAKSVGLSRQAVLRIAADPDAAYARVAKWQ
jgi:DNA invertase Pin-like site-specific DNA recombinase